MDYEFLGLGIRTIWCGNFKTLHLVWHLAGAQEMVNELNWFEKSQGITLLHIQMGKPKLKEPVDVFALCFALY